MASPDGRPVAIPRVPWHENPLRAYHPDPNQAMFKKIPEPKEKLPGARSGRCRCGAKTKDQTTICRCRKS